MDTYGNDNDPYECGSDSEPEANELRITSVHYSRLFSLGNYENEKFGASAPVAEDEDPQLVLNDLKAWVQSQARDREMRENLQVELHELERKRLEADRKLGVIERRYDELSGFFIKHGIVPLPEPSF